MYLDSNDLCWQFVYWEYIWSNIMHKYDYNFVKLEACLASTGAW